MIVPAPEGCMCTFKFVPTFYFMSPHTFKWEFRVLNQCCPIEVCVNMFYTCIAQYGNHWPHVATKHLICVAAATEEVNCKLYFILINLNSHLWLMTNILDAAALNNSNQADSTAGVQNGDFSASPGVRGRCWETGAVFIAQASL